VFLVKALYEQTHPEYANYLYLVAPVNLLLLNPIGFILMEISKQRDLDSRESEANGAKGVVYEKPSFLTVMSRVTKGVLLNPIIIMTALGICGNLIFSHCVPTILQGILKASTTLLILVHCLLTIITH